MTYYELHRNYPEHFPELEERAAIMEFTGNMDRRTAESRAVQRLQKKYGLWFGKDTLQKGERK